MDKKLIMTRAAIGMVVGVVSFLLISALDEKMIFVKVATMILLSIGALIATYLLPTKNSIRVLAVSTLPIMISYFIGIAVVVSVREGVQKYRDYKIQNRLPEDMQSGQVYKVPTK